MSPNSSKADHFLTYRNVTIRIKRIQTGGHRQPYTIGGGTFCVKKLVRYEITHNGRYLWSEPGWMKARARARYFANKIAESRSATDGE